MNGFVIDSPVELREDMLGRRITVIADIARHRRNRETQTLTRIEPFTAKFAEGAKRSGVMIGTNPRQIGIPWDEQGGGGVDRRHRT